MTLFKFFIIFFFLLSASFAQIPVINEVMSLNSTIIDDNDGDYPDWIEIYNPSTSAIQLSGYGLSDDLGNLYKWSFPDFLLPAKGFVMVFASDKNYNLSVDNLHTNFKIKSKGEKIILTHPSGEIADSVHIVPLAVDISYGRSPDGAENWALFNKPTPGFSNDTQPAAGFSSEPVFSKEGGFFQGTQVIEITTNSDGRIRYTTNGADPNKNSRSYLNPISITKTTVIKARVFEENKLPGPVVTHTFFINEQSLLPVVSLSTHPDNLFDEDIGIYVEGNGTALGGYPDNPIGPPANYWEDWERPIHIDFFEPYGRPGFNVNAGLKMFGKTTRTLPQKSFAIFFRNKYGQEELNYSLFPKRPIYTFKSFLLRNAGSDNTENLGGVQFRDGLTAVLLQNLDLDFQAYRPCCVFINGEYWGIYGIREKINEDYLTSHHGVETNQVDILDDYHTLYPHVVEGDANHYNALVEYLVDHNLANNNYADYVDTQMNVDNFLTYMAVQIFYANQDGPGHNCKFWRPKVEDGRYRWLLYDTDHSFGQRLFIPNFHYEPEAYLDNTIAYYREENGPSWPNPPESTFMFRKILENQNFRFRFINKLADLMNSIFYEETTLESFNALKKLLESEISRHLNRWGGSLSEWRENIQVIDDFLVNRSFYLSDHIVNEFGLEGLAKVEVDVSPPDAGQIKLNSLSISSFPWYGLYYQGVPLQIIALPNLGYSFVGWSGINHLEPFNLMPDGDLEITAIFEPRTIEEKIVINEINYNSSPEYDTGDWIELYNPTDNPIYLFNWIFMDSDTNHRYIFSDISIDALGFLVLCRDIDKSKLIKSNVKIVEKNMDFGLNNSETIRLYNSQKKCIDSVAYSDNFPWIWQANGSGATLALKDPNLDNNLAENWMPSFPHGTPGEKNSYISRIENEKNKDFQISSCYPNPFNSTITIEYQCPYKSLVKIGVYDILGRFIQTLVDDYLDSGFYKIQWDGKDSQNSAVPTGIYFLLLQNNSRSELKKVLLVR